MAFFNRSQGNKLLFIGQQPAGDLGWCAYVLPQGSTYDQPGIELRQSFDELPGSYVFSFQDVDVAGENATRFVAAVWQYLNGAISPNRGILWLLDYPEPGKGTFSSLGFSTFQGQTTVANALTGNVSDTLKLRITNSCLLTLDDATQALRIKENEGGKITFNTIEGIAKSEVEPNLATLPFTGQGRGCLQFGLFIRQGTDFDIFDFGLKYFIPNPDPKGEVLQQRYPLLRPDVQSADDRVGFSVWIDLTNLENAGTCTSQGCPRTFFAFTGKNLNGNSTLLPSAFVSATGYRLDLVPVVDPGLQQMPPGATSALMVLAANPRVGQNRYLIPQGDLQMTFAATPPAGEVPRLLCGLAGTETIRLKPPAGGAGDRLRFVARQPAWAPNFPFQQASPTGPPMDPDAAVLTAQFVTSWLTVVRADGSPAQYAAQPTGSSLFGRDALINPAFGTLLGPEDPGYRLPDAKVFPLAPYASVAPAVPGLSQQQIEQLERQVISPTRRSRIGAPPAGPTPLAAEAVTTKNVTTPSGIVATVATAGESSTWTSILLGQNLAAPKCKGQPLTLQFVQPDPKLQQAFQSNSLFLVAANACNLGKLTGWTTGPACPDAAASAAVFENQINVEDWVLAANVGVENRYNDYRNVLIVKGRQGALWDPGEGASGLVQNPDLWTQRGDFASPTFLTPQADGKEKFEGPDPNQQIILAQWLQDYFLAASRQTSPYFQAFNTLALDPNWTGILLLRADIVCLPTDLQGILAGVRDPASFNAHHFGINVSKIDPQNVEVDRSSSMFGLIYYVDSEFDDNFDPAVGPAPVQPTAGEPYDFITLSLKVQFENTAVKGFNSATQLTLNQLFESTVDHMGEGGNPYNTVILRGSFQKNGDQTVYSMSSQSDDTFFFDSNVLNKVEVNGVQLSTRASKGDELVAWFALSGFMDFKIVRYDDSQCAGDGETAEDLPFDVFSFGGDEPGSDQPRQGLAFSNLGLEMRFKLTGSGSGAPKKTFTFVIDEVFFNIGSSTPRRGSLFEEFALELMGIVRGTEEDQPASHSYLPVLTAAPLAGVEGPVWYGLRFRLNLGSPGALAGKVGLNSFLLAAWSTESSGGTYQAEVGIQLPGTGGGAKLISLQNVLKLSIGQIWLNRALQTGTGGRKWLLLFNEIALKFLGLLKIPPSGSSTFYLYGDPKGGGKPSGLGWYAIYKQDSEGK